MAQVKRKFGKLSRRERIPLSASVSIAKVLSRRSYGPGVHGPKPKRGRMSIYGVQLREKQKAKLMYDLREKQFRGYYAKATQKQGDTGELLVRMLETRFDNALHRLGLAKTRQQARQLISHKFFTINGTTVNIRSYQVKPGDVIALKETKKNKALIAELKEYAKTVTTPSWLSADPEALSGTVLSEPSEEDLKQPFDPKLIIEFYSR